MTASAYDTHAIHALASALDDVLADLEHRRERPIGVAEKRNLTMNVTQRLLEAYDDGERDLEALRRAGAAGVVAAARWTGLAS
jgi:hypothetical protein